MEENEEVNRPLLNIESDNNDNEKIEESIRAIRASFIVKVYSILLFQLFITLLFYFLFKLIPQNKKEFLFYFFLIIPFVCFIIIFIYPNLIRKCPYNFIILILFTIGISYTNSYITSSSSGSVVFLLFLKFVDVVTLILYANERDFTLYSESVRLSFPSFSSFEQGQTDPSEIEGQKKKCRELLCDHVEDCFLIKINWFYFVFNFHRILLLNFGCDICNNKFDILMHKTQSGKEIIINPNPISYNNYYSKKWEYILKSKISYGFCEQCFDEASGDWTIIKNNCGDFAKFIWEKIKKKDS